MSADIKCPHCEGVEFVTGVKVRQAVDVGGIGLAYRAAVVFDGVEPLHADLCKACGTVARLYVTQTDRDWSTG